MLTPHIRLVYILYDYPLKIIKNSYKLKYLYALELYSDITQDGL